MTDIDTTKPVVHRLPGQHPARGRSPLRPDVAGQPVIDTSVDARATVFPLNDAAAIYEALAEEIEGTAVGWSPSALARLERGLLERYGPLIGGRHPVRRLVRLAARPVTS